MKKVVVLDTSMLCVHFAVPGKETCGPQHDRWDRMRLAKKLAEEESSSATLVVPLAALIETGNHIANARSYQLALELGELLRRLADAESPWAAFSEQHGLWTDTALRDLADGWPDLAVRGISLADATIERVADYYSRAGRRVEILTGDRGLKSLEPAPGPQPRRRRR